MTDRTKITLGDITVVGEDQGDVLTVGSGGIVVASGVSGGSGTDENAIHDNVASEISAITEKTAPVDNDLFIIEDSEASNAKKRLKVSNLPGGADADAIHDNVAGEINAISSKSSLSLDDIVVIEDSESSYAKKKATITSIVTLASGSGGGGIPDYSYWSPDAIPDSPDSDNDEFDGEGGAGTPSGWSLCDHGSNLDFGVERDAGFEFSSGTPSEITGYYKACGSISTFQSLRAYVKASVYGAWDNSSSGFYEVGVAFYEDATSSTGDIYTFGLRLKKDTGIGLRGCSWTAYNASPTEEVYLEIDPPMFNSCYLAVEANEIFGSFAYIPKFSTGGGWIQIASSSTVTFTPTHYGIYCLGSDGGGLIHWFRVFGPGSMVGYTYSVQGNRVDGYLSS